MTGTVGNDTLNSTSANDTLTGGAGSDTFVFAQNFGHDTIVDFRPGQDHIDLTALSAVVNASNFNTWFSANVTTSPTNYVDTLITLDSADNITLHNVAVANLHATDFIIHA